MAVTFQQPLTDTYESPWYNSEYIGKCSFIGTAMALAMVMQGGSWC